MKLSVLIRIVIVILFLKINSFAQAGQNAIDMLHADSEVIAFLEKNMAFRPDKITFTKYGGRPGVIMDSLKARNWVKMDLDHNGKTDLVVLKLDGNLYLDAVLDMGDKYAQLKPIYNTKYNLVYPVVKKIGKQDVFLLYNQTRLGYDADKDRFEYSKMMCDTIVFMYDNFINYSSANYKLGINSVKIHVSGQCEGKCPEVNYMIDMVKMVGTGVKTEGGSDAILHSQLSKKDVELVKKILLYSNFVKFKSNYAVDGYDQITTTTEIISSGNKNQVIKDYGSFGNFSLAAVYRIIENAKWSKAKKK